MACPTLFIGVDGFGQTVLERLDQLVPSTTPWIAKVLCSPQDVMPSVEKELNDLFRVARFAQQGTGGARLAIFAFITLEQASQGAYVEPAYLCNLLARLLLDRYGNMFIATAEGQRAASLHLVVLVPPMVGDASTVAALQALARLEQWRQ
ncbi:MAG: hypothetical protein WCI05_11380, partial [Myxococcales bacterium]